MNEKFFKLPEEKQQSIINAGFRVFSQNSYRKSPMSEIADAAGISKSLLFHYFQNKHELYLFLWDKGGQLTIESMTKAGCYEDGDLFELMERGMRAKIRIMKIYPDMTSFIIKAFFEKDPEVSADIHKDYRRILNLKAASTLKNLDPEDFVPGLDLSMMYKEMFMASAGYLWEAVQHEGIDADKLERDFGEMIAFWKSLYCRKEGDA